ncbi:hypothetical protein D3C76_1247110 [compost metagenome]
MNLLKHLWAQAGGGLGLQYHTVLAGLGIDGRDLALAEGVIQGIGDVRDVDAQAAGSIAVDHQEHLQTLVLQVAGHVGQFRALLQGIDQLATPQGEQVGVR